MSELSGTRFGGDGVRLCSLLVSGVRGFAVGLLVATGPAWASTGALVAPQATTKIVEAAAPSRGLVDKYCVTCHSRRLKTANLVLEGFDLADVKANGPALEKILTKLRVNQMPPSTAPRPDESAKRAFMAELEASMDAAITRAPNPGYVPAHRISRVEYVNAIHDILGIEVDGASLLPADSAAVGFDNDSGVLKVTPALMSRYVSAATKISRQAIGSADIRPVSFVYRVPEYLRQETRMSEDLPFGTFGGAAFRYAFPLDGEYLIKLRMKRANLYDVVRGLDYDVNIEVRLDKSIVRRFEIEAKYPGPDPGILVSPTPEDVEGYQRHQFRLNADNNLEVRLPVRAGSRMVSAAFADAPTLFERVPMRPRAFKSLIDNDDADTPGIDSIEVSGPFNAVSSGETDARRRIFSCRPARVADEEPCAARIFSGLARRAYRRPVTKADVTPLLAFYRRGRQGGSFESGIERALEALLVSPHFLLRVEHSPAVAGAAGSQRISDIELASRLSFFLWSSIPDEPLLLLAEQGRLSSGGELERQVRRMLADPKAAAFVDGFSSQWLITRNVQQQNLDPALFPDVDANLQGAIGQEMELFMRSQVQEDHSVLDLLRADYTFLNERLAKHYGVPGVYGSHFRRVTLRDSHRFGLLGKGAVHMVSAYANRTSVVLRGKWVMEYLLDAPPPSPPANVPPLKESDAKKPTTLRERMEQHRSNPVCSSCHSAMDPLGFALESFDASGRWRTSDEGVLLDTVSVLPDGSKLDGVAGLRQFVLDQRRDSFVQAAARRLLGYAMRRQVQYSDMPTVRQVLREAAKDDYRWSSLILGVVRSMPFQMRSRPDAGSAPVGRVALAGGAPASRPGVEGSAR